MMTQTRIGGLLHDDHMETVETLQALDDILHRNRDVPAVSGDVAAVLARLQKTLRAEVEKHFGFEENHLFPVFIAQGETGIVMMLTGEHRTILPLATEIADRSEQALANGFDADGWKAFRAAGSELVEREMFHIQKEEMGLLAAISALVDPATDAKLAEIYVQVVG
jgi:hemerythrin-like domain-containing protein